MKRTVMSPEIQINYYALFLQISREEQELRFKYKFFKTKILVCQIKITSTHTKTSELSLMLMHRQLQALEANLQATLTQVYTLVYWH